MNARHLTAAGTAPIAMAAASILLPFLILGAGAGTAPLPAGPALCAGGGTAQTIAGITLDPEQMGNAETITAVTASRHLPNRAATVALATAMQESGLRNLNHGDRDSLGLFQQRPSQGWGTPAQITNPVHATTTFLQHLTAVPNWQTIPLTQAAQAVQHSAFPDAYAHWEPLAHALTDQLWPTAAAATTATPGPGTPFIGLPAVACIHGPGPTGIGGDPAAGARGIPAGLVVDGSSAAQTAVRYALAQLGKPYEWGAAGPNAYDCSGLTMAAWSAAGIALPHHAVDQATRGTPTTLADAVAGDLVFIPGADGTPQQPGHVGMIIGHAAGHTYLIQAPTEGIPIELTDTAQWIGEITAIRHIG
jgi:cell wall-associated NlpC family hydrolase